LTRNDLVANAGLVLPATLAQRLSLPELLRHHVHLGKMAGAANPDHKAMAAIASLLAGGEHMNGVNALCVGGAGAEILGVVPAAAFTVGTSPASSGFPPPTVSCRSVLLALPFTFDPVSMPVMLAFIVAVASLATMGPAWSASRVGSPTRFATNESTGQQPGWRRNVRFHPRSREVTRLRKEFGTGASSASSPRADQ
jgi:hypothetical protein